MKSVTKTLTSASARHPGDWNWHLPRWLDWLPRLEVEGRSRPAREVAQS